MRMNANIQAIGKFQDVIEACNNCYNHAVFSYTALKQGNNSPLLLSGSVQLSAAIKKSTLDLFEIKTDSIIAGIKYFKLKDGLAFLEELKKGYLILPNGKKFLISSDANDLNAHYDSGVSQILSSKYRTARLAITGGDNIIPINLIGGEEKIDSELRCATTPFDGIFDLLNNLKIHLNQFPRRCELNILAFNIIELDRSSNISNGKARLKILAGPSVNPKSIKIGVLPVKKTFSDRKSLTGSKLKWQTKRGISTGSINLEIGEVEAALVIVSYNGIVFDRYWIFDSTKHINPIYTVHDSIDSNLEKLRGDLLGNPNNTKRQDHFEEGVSLLLKLFNFNVIEYGKRDWVDMIAVTPSQQIAIVECTTELPTVDKLTKLIGRVERLRTSLQSSGNSHIEILPMLITARSNNAQESFIIDAAKRGIYVATKEDIDELLNRVRIPPSSSDIFKQAKDSVEQRAKHLNA